MAFGDLTSGINMLPDNSINQGFKEMTSALGSIEQAKTAQAEKNINQFNQLTNVNLKGLQASAMDEAVAKRDNMIKQIAKWYATDGPMGLSWEHQKQAMAMKNDLETLVTQSQENQKMVEALYKEAMSLKDPKRQQLMLDQINQAISLPTVEQKNKALSSIVPPAYQYSANKAIYSYNPSIKNRRYFNDKEAFNFYKTEFDNGNLDVVGYVNHYIETHSGKTVDDAFKSLVELRKSLVPLLPSIEEQARQKTRGTVEGKNDVLNKPIKPDPNNPNYVSMVGANYKGKPIVVGDVTVLDDKGKPMPVAKAQLVGFENKPDGEVVAHIIYPRGRVGSGLNFVSSKEILDQIMKGTNPNYGEAEIPATALINQVDQLGLNFSKVPWLKDYFSGETDNNELNIVSSYFNK